MLKIIFIDMILFIIVEAVWSLGNIACGTTKHVQAILDAGMVQQFYFQRFPHCIL